MNLCIKCSEVITVCGITGFINYKKIISESDKNILFSMGETLNRRGPDEKDEYCSNSVGLAHRRLSVIDIKNGHQPMIKENNNKYICNMLQRRTL